MISGFNQVGQDLAMAMMYQKANPYAKDSSTTSADVSSLEGRMNAKSSQLQQRINHLEQQVRSGNGNVNQVPVPNTSALEGRIGVMEKDLSSLKKKASVSPPVEDTSVLKERIRVLERDMNALRANPLAPTDLIERISSLEVELNTLLTNQIDTPIVVDTSALEERISKIETDVVRITTTGSNTQEGNVSGAIEALKRDMVKIQTATLTKIPMESSLDSSVVKKVNRQLKGVGLQPFKTRGDVQDKRRKWLSSVSKRVIYNNELGSPNRVFTNNLTDILTTSVSYNGISDDKYDDVLYRFLMNIISDRLKESADGSLDPPMKLSTSLFSDIVKGKYGESVYFSTVDEIEYIVVVYNHLMKHVFKDRNVFPLIQTEEEKKSFLVDSILYFISMNNSMVSLRP